MVESESSIQARIKKWSGQNQNQVIEMLRNMVQSQSLPGSEDGIQAYISGILNRMGMDVDVWEPSVEMLRASPHFWSERTEFSNSPNVVGVLKGTGAVKGEGRSLILNGHVDVVPVGDIEQWEDDPWSGKIIENRLYGRGSTDMKGGLASAIAAVQCLRDLDIDLQGDVTIQSVVDEESGGAGTLSALMRGYRADAVIIPEPTNMRIFPKQQGSLWFRIRVKGLSAHGGTRYKGISAIEKAVGLLENIRLLESERNQRITDPLYANTPIPIPINIGAIRGGEWPSSVPDSVQIEGRMGIAPNENVDDAKEQLETVVQDVAQSDPWLRNNVPSVEWFGARWLPGQVSAEHPLLANIVSGYQSIKNSEPKIEASPWGTDGGLMQTVGGMPFVVFGPGTTEQAHFPNEYVEIEKVMECAQILAMTIVKWCGVQI